MQKVDREALLQSNVAGGADKNSANATSTTNVAVTVINGKKNDK